MKSTSTHRLVDADVASQYPSIIEQLGLYPKALGPEFLKVYSQIKIDRIKAKKRAKEIKRELPGVNDPDRIASLKAELERCTVQDKGGKIQLNGVYGKLGSAFSVLHAPHLLIAVTLTGQLTLLMMIEWAEEAGIPVVSANTDGVLFKVPREKYDGLSGDRLNPSVLEELTSQWELETGFDFEFGEYESIWNASVNTYYAIKPNGGHKRKGAIGNPWNKHPDDFDPVRGQLMKNPQMTICSDAALAMIKHGTPLETTILNCKDISGFLTVIKATGGAVWGGEVIPMEGDEDLITSLKGGEYLGKTIRYYWGIDGQPIFEAKPNASGNHKKISKTDGAIECMNLPDEFPSDIDYNKYVQEARDILISVGFYGNFDPDEKAIKPLKQNRSLFLAASEALF
jgi:hypothetical protein